MTPELAAAILRCANSMWVLTRSCVRTPEGFRVVLQPFALTAPAREGWDALTDEA